MKLSVSGVDVPPFLYGTAWKEERTAALVEQAIAAGFRGIDTANQRRHYNEAGVGAAIRARFERGTIERDQLFLQTKFTYLESQDARLPYDPAADYPDQVRQSFASSLEHLGVDRLDSYLLHGPRTRSGLSTIDRMVWRTIEEIQREGGTRLIGISNVTAGQLEMLLDVAQVKPAFVQNRCFARLGWDHDVREVCRRNEVLYQGFSLLTANISEIESRPVRRIAENHGKSIAQVIFRFAHQLGMVCLTGTTDSGHMHEDLDALTFELSEEEVAVIENISG